MQVVSSGEVCSCFRAKQSFLGLVRSEIARNTRTCTMEDLTACFLAGSSTVFFSVSTATFLGASIPVEVASTTATFILSLGYTPLEEVNRLVACSFSLEAPAARRRFPFLAQGQDFSFLTVLLLSVVACHLVVQHIWRFRNLFGQNLQRVWKKLQLGWSPQHLIFRISG